MFVGTPNSKPSKTRYNLIEQFKDAALLEVSPLTGRRHQIRVHLAAVGHPLLVDPIYGKRDCYPSANPVISRLTLHAWKLSFDGSDEKQLSFEAPPPEDFEKLLELLRKNN